LVKFDVYNYEQILEGQVCYQWRFSHGESRKAKKVPGVC